MRKLYIATASAALALASAGPLQAAVMASAPALHLYPATQTIYCDIVNLNTTPKDVTIEVVDYFGVVTTGPSTSTLAPFQGTALGEGGGLQGAYCRFTVSGSAKKYRAMAIYDNGTSYTVAVPAQ